MHEYCSIDLTKPSMWGHVYITDRTTGEILADCYNQIHFENMSVAIAKSLAQQQSGFIQQMAFGNGGSIVNGAGAITYFPPNTTGASSHLYNETYRKVINNQSPADLNVSANFILVNHTLSTTYSDLIITCTLDYSEPAGQEAFDTATDLNGIFVFDELGLISYDTDTTLGSLLTHVIFNPIQKSLNRQIEIVYTLRISLT
jgi:hypothetical protein